MKHPALLVAPRIVGAHIVPADHSEHPYPAASRTPRELRFSASGDPELEQAYKTHWLSPDLNQTQRARLTERAARRPGLVVIEPQKAFTCSVCGAERPGC